MLRCFLPSGDRDPAETLTRESLGVLMNEHEWRQREGLDPRPGPPQPSSPLRLGWRTAELAAGQDRLPLAPPYFPLEFEARQEDRRRRCQNTMPSVAATA